LNIAIVDAIQILLSVHNELRLELSTVFVSKIIGSLDTLAASRRYASPRLLMQAFVLQSLTDSVTPKRESLADRVASKRVANLLI
jgi:hypothetical protein